MQKFIARSNVEHFKKLIANEIDETKRSLLERMLDEEQARLDGLEVASSEPQSGPETPLRHAD